MRDKKKIVISAINFFEGGPLSVLKDCLSFLNSSEYLSNYEFTALVHKHELFDNDNYSNIRFVEFQKSRKSYFYRIYYEYFYFKKFAKANDVYFWLSLHDMTPRLDKVQQAVYCHNASPFNTLNLKDIYYQPKQFLFRLFYQFLYQVNIKRNKYVIVQQLWMKNKFVKMFHVPESKVIIAKPQIPEIPSKYLLESNNSSGKKVFFFPTFPRPFKNIEVICKAVKILTIDKDVDFEVVITIDGTENTYSKYIVDTYKSISSISFVGIVSRRAVYEYYAKCDCLIFPSKLESWGLPISEFKQYNKPMLVANLPYAKETVGNYKYVNFFNVDDSLQLAGLMREFLDDKMHYEKTSDINYSQPYVDGWNELFQKLLS